MTNRLAVFWYELETSFPLGGARRKLRTLLGEALECDLERTGILEHRRVATTYPCARWAGDGCPRVVRHSADGRVVAFCGNVTRQCETIEMRMNDIDFLAVSVERLAAAVAKPLHIRPRFERLPAIREGFRFGTFVPEPGLQHTIYFLARCGERDYGEGLDALRTHARGQTLAVLLPTDRFISENIRRQAVAAGIPLLSLADCIGIGDDGSLRALVPPLQLFADVRPDDGPHPVSASYVAHAFVRERGRAPVWRGLDEAAYQRMIGDVSAYDVITDEIAGSVIKPKLHPHVPSWHFKTIRAALGKRGHYDPGTGDDDGLAARQMFQRARRLFDIKNEGRWAIFPTERIDNHAVYRFDPDPSVTFAFVFAANGANRMPRLTIDSEVTPTENLARLAIDRRPGAKLT